MLRSLENLLGYQIAATNGTMGTISDFLVVDDSWTVRYLVVAAGGWLDRKEVLLSVESIGAILDVKREVTVKMTRELVYGSPDVETDKPVTRQKEILLAKHYGWKASWRPDPFLGVDLPTERMAIDEDLEGSNRHLRSFRELSTYSIDGNLMSGFLIDMIVDSSDEWRILSIVRAANRGRSGDAVLIPPQKVTDIIWRDRMLRIAEDGEPLQPFNLTAGVNPVQVVKHFDYHGRLHSVTMLPEAPRSGGAAERGIHVTHA